MEGQQGDMSLTFVDTVESCTSLRIGGEAVHAKLVRDARDVDRVVSPAQPADLSPWLGRRPAVARLEDGRTVVLSYLANYLGRANYLVPDLQRDRLRVLFVGWEIEQLTTELLAELRGGDVVMGTSDFVTEVFARHLPDTPVISAKHCPPMPEGVTPDRARWGLTEDKVHFLYIFDPGSGFDRKNPIDVHRAFTMAFPDRDDVRLVFKVHGGLDGAAEATDADGERRRSREFLDAIADDPRVILIREFLSYLDVMRLVASCDVFVSLSRAEGIGLPVLEAMTLGIPTVCTAYSGHLDFTTPTSALLVPVSLIDIPEGASHHYQPAKYSERPKWAQPDLAVAADHLRLLADDADARSKWGRRAAAQAAVFRQSCHDSGWVTDLLRALESDEVRRNHPARAAHYLAHVDPQAREWADHDLRVWRARRSLRLRTWLGHLKRTLLGRRSPSA